MPVPYDFKRTSGGNFRRSAGGKRLRFFAVLCVVAAVTVGVVMLIVPEKAKVAEKSGKEDLSSGKAPATPGDDSGSSRENRGELSGGGNDSGESGENVSGGNSAGGDNPSTIAPQPADSGSGGGSSKGVVRPDDPPLNEDTPEFRSGQTPGANELIARIKGMESADEIAALSREFLMKEYSAGGEFSEAWNSVGAELAAAIRNKWQTRNWKKETIIHKVIARDHLIRISRRNNATVEGIKFINKRKNNFLRIGEKLRVIPGPWQVTVSRKARLLNVWRKEKNAWNIFTVFPVGVGRKNSTPVGTFVITHRLRHPKWHGPDGRIFAYGDKENPLGDYFLKLRQIDPHGSKEDKGYGIHGSGEDSSVGRSLSNGCLRMHNRDVEILYYLLPGDCPVKIVD